MARDKLAGDVRHTVDDQAPSETKHRQPNIMVGTETGGQWKTGLARLLAYGIERGGLTPSLAAADQVYNGQSKLAAVTGCPVLELGTGPGIGAEKEQSVAYWDNLGDALAQENCVLDVGANVVAPILAWARRMKAGTAMGFRPLMLVVPVTAGIISARDAHHVLKASYDRDVEAGLNVKGRVVIFNTFFGPIDRVHGTMDDLRRYISEHDVPTITVGTLGLSPAFEVVPFSKIEGMTARQHAAIVQNKDEASLRVSEIAPSIRQLQDWRDFLNPFLSAAQALKLIPPSNPLPELE